MGLNLEAGSSMLQSSSVHSCGVNAIDIAGDDLVITGGDDGAISVVNRDKVTTFRHRHSGQISGLKVITSGKIQALFFGGELFKKQEFTESRKLMFFKYKHDFFKNHSLYQKNICSL